MQLCVCVCARTRVHMCVYVHYSDGVCTQIYAYVHYQQSTYPARQQNHHQLVKILTQK